MSRRRGVQVTHQVVVNGHGAPANFRTVSAHVRVYWPPNATREQVLTALAHALDLTLADLRKTLPEEDA